MTPELLYQRRWERIAEVLEACSDGVVVPVVMPPSEGGGILIVLPGRAFHFTNHGNIVNAEISEADTSELIESRRNCFRLDQPLLESGQAVCEHIISGSTLEDLNNTEED